MQDRRVPEKVKHLSGLAISAFPNSATACIALWSSVLGATQDSDPLPSSDLKLIRQVWPWAQLHYISYFPIKHHRKQVCFYKHFIKACDKLLKF